MKFTESFSADMDDLFVDDKRRTLLKWAGDFLAAVEKKSPVARSSLPVRPASTHISRGKHPPRLI